MISQAYFKVGFYPLFPVELFIKELETNFGISAAHHACQVGRCSTLSESIQQSCETYEEQYGSSQQTQYPHQPLWSHTSYWCVMFHNTCPGFHNQSTTFMTSKIPRHQVLHSNSVVVSSQPWILFTVKSHLLFSSDPATMCLPFMYISHLLCFCPHLVYPRLCTHRTSVLTDLMLCPLTRI